MNTINVSFSTLPAATAKQPESEVKKGPDPTCRPKKSGKTVKQRRVDARKAKQLAFDKKHPQPTPEMIKDRWRIMMQEHNMLMLTRISYERVRGTADRNELAGDLLLDLVECRQNTPLAEAVMLLDSPDGASGRGRAHRIISNKALNRAAGLITRRDREVCSDFTEVQRQAVTAAVKHDGPWAKLDYDSRSTINREVAARSKDPLGIEWRDMEFTRRAEAINEISGPAWVSLHKERSLVDMLNDTMRTHGMAATGRLNQDDARQLKDWQHRFFTKWPRITDKRSEAFTITVMEAAERLQTTKVRQWAWLMLQLDQGGLSSDERLTFMDIVRGEVTSLGKLVASCTSATTERSGGTKKANDRTPEYMQVRWSTVCNMLGLEPTSSNRKTLSKLVVRMAEQAGAQSTYDNGRGIVSQMDRFPTRFKEQHTSGNTVHFGLRNAVGQCGCSSVLVVERIPLMGKVHMCSTCRTKVGFVSKQTGGVSFWADRETDVEVQGRRSDFALLGATYGAMHDLVCWLSGKQFVPFEQYRQAYIADRNEQHCDDTQPWGVAMGGGLGFMQQGF